MELKKHLNLRFVFVGLYLVAFLAFLVYGLQPAEAAEAYEIDAELLIPSIGLETEVTKLELEEDGLKTPDTIAGSYTRFDNKTLLIGHSTTVFKNLENVKIGDKIEYNDKTYTVEKITLSVKDKIDMDELLKASEKDTIAIMTCAGELLDGGDATHRLIITASSE